MKRIILAIALGIMFWGCYTQIGTIKEDEGYSVSESKPKVESKENYSSADDYNYYDSWIYHSRIYDRYAYRYYLPYPRYYLFFRYYTPGFAMGWGWSDWWYSPSWWYDYYYWGDWYWWDRYYWYSYWYFPTWYYYPWWYRAPVIVIINNPYYSPGYGKDYVYRTRNFGSTRIGVRDARRSSSTDGNLTVPPPSRTVPTRTSSVNTQSASGEGSLRKPNTPTGETPTVEKGRSEERTRSTGATRTSSTPRIVLRVVPRSSDENSGTQNTPSTPRGTPPRRTGTHRNSIQTYRDYNTGRSTLIEAPRHNFPSNFPRIERTNVLNHPAMNVSTQFEQRTEQRRHIGQRR